MLAARRALGRPSWAPTTNRRARRRAPRASRRTRCTGAQLCVFFRAEESRSYENRSAHRLSHRDTSAHAARTRVHRPRRRYASLAVASLLHRALLARASARALASARVVRAALRAASMLRLSARRASAFHSSRARSSVAVAARPGRAALSESYARAGLTARRARRPGGGARPSVRSAQLEFSSRKSQDLAKRSASNARVARAHPSLNRRIAP